MVKDPADEKLTVLARETTLALGDDSLRFALFQLMQRSRLRYQAVPLDSLVAADSRGVLAARRSTSALLAGNSSRPVVLVMPSAISRRTWDGGAALSVGAASIGQHSSGRKVTTFDSAGRDTVFDAQVVVGRRFDVLISIDPTLMNQTKNPLRSRSRTSRGTVSTSWVECDDDPTQDYCDEPTGGYIPPGPIHVPTPYCSPSQAYVVTNSSDTDADGMKDECEVELAQAFEPELLFEAQELHQGREPHFIVESFDGTIQIGYLLSYYYDGGAYSHNGDSELIIVRVKGRIHDWELKNITTTAHYGVPWWGLDETRTFTWDKYQFVATPTRARIFVSRSHHGNYDSHGRCNNRFGDVCSTGPHDGGFLQPAGRSYGGTTGLRHDNNIGNARVKLAIDPLLRFGSTSGLMSDCTYATNPWMPGFECYIWEGGGYSSGGTVAPWANSFAGWHGTGGTTSYPDILQSFGFLFL